MSPTAQSEIDGLAIPGTVYLVDLDNSLGVKHGPNGEIILIPVPSDDPEDPLNWSQRRKVLSVVCVFVYTFFVGFSSATIYSVIIPLSLATDLTVGDFNSGTGYLFLLAGWGLLFWQPFAFQYGKRPTYLISLAVVLATMIWSPYCKGSGQWYAKNIIQGFFGSPIEALPEISVTDVFFAHQRGTYMAIYALAFAGSNFFAPLVCGYIAERMGWQWVFYWPAIFLGFALVFCFFFMEETNYQRKQPVITEGVIPTSENLVQESNSSATYSAGSAEKVPATTDATLEANLSVRILYPKKTYLQKLALKDAPKKNVMLNRALQQLKFMTWPVVIFSGFSYGSYLIWFNVLNATASVILSAPPYLFSASQVGLSYLAPCLGVLAGAAFTGPFSDWLTICLARRNKGIKEAEQRLWPFIACLILTPSSLILWGVGASNQIHWFGLIFSMFMLSFTVTCGLSFSVNYLIDSYQEMSGDSMVAMMIIRNTMGFAVSYGVTPWLENLGVHNCFISAAFIALAASSGFLIMIKFGKGLRERSRVKYWAKVHEKALWKD